MMEAFFDKDYAQNSNKKQTQPLTCQNFEISQNYLELKFKEHISKICNIINETRNTVHGYAISHELR